MEIKKVVIACDSFKGSISSVDAACAIEKGIKAVFNSAKVVTVPIADGGEGFVDALVLAMSGEKVKFRTTGPLFESVDGYLGVTGDVAIIEMASVSGLMLIGESQRNPMKTTSLGTGELIKAALDKGLRKIIIGIGGSATNDGGIGMATALGVKFLDASGNTVVPTGEGMGRVASIDISGLDQRILEADIRVACDVDNPLYGKNGAGYVYAPQKGADASAVKTLDSNLKALADVIASDMDIDIKTMSGAGAAGGLGAGLVAFLGAEIKPGIELVLDAVGFDALIHDADLVITGEGRIDGQSINGKAPIGVAARAKKANVPVIALTGAVGEDYERVYEHGIDAVFSISRMAMPFEQIKAFSAEFLRQTTTDIMRLIKRMGPN